MLEIIYPANALLDCVVGTETPAKLASDPKPLELRREDTSVPELLLIRMAAEGVYSLGKIDFSKFHTKSLQPINALTSMRAKFNNLKLENFNANIQAINSKAFVEMLENLKMDISMQL